MIDRILHDIDEAMETHLHENYNLYYNQDELYIEVVNNRGEGQFIPLSQYDGNSKWDAETIKRGHLEIGKGGEEVPGGIGSRKEVPDEGLTNAERRFKMGEALEDDIIKPVHNLKVYHGTNVDFKRFSIKFSYQGIIWFTDNINKIKNNEHGGHGHSIIMTANITLEKPAGWPEYEKYGIGQLKGLGYDGVVLSDGDGYNDYIIFNTKSIKNVKK